MTPNTVPVAVEISYLEMHRPPRQTSLPGELTVRRVPRPTPTLNRFLYAAVGADWLWHSRLGWDHDRWLDVLSAEGHETWLGYVDDGPAGYFELQRMPDEGRTEIQYFGLLPEHIGRGVGAPFLEACVREAWRDGATRVVSLNTCTLDHPRALRNYLAAGFVVVRTERTVEQVPADPLEPWPGAGWAPITRPEDHAPEA